MKRVFYIMNRETEIITDVVFGVKELKYLLRNLTDDMFVVKEVFDYGTPYQSTEYLEYSTI